MNISLLGIFLEGILSFLSPCVLPLLPLYMSYLSNDSKTIDEQGNVKYKVSKVFLTTLFFVLGISLTFVLLAVSINYASSYIEKYNEIISIIGGTLLIIFGLHELNIIHIDVLDKELKLKLNLKLNNMNCFKAFLLGFVFSLGWSPCIGPMLASAIMLAATNSNGYLYIAIYGLGLVIPFLITGLLTAKVLNFINEKKKLFKWVLKIAGIVLICFGIYMIYTSSSSIVTLKENKTENSDINIQTELMDYEFYDQNNNIIKLSDYKGKYVFLNFTTTWCTYCKQEKPEFEEFSKNKDIVCLYVMSPLQEYSSDAIDNYLKNNNSNINTIIDLDATLFYYCNISSFPTTVVITPDNKFYTYYPGALDLLGFNQLLQYCKDNYE